MIVLEVTMFWDNGTPSILRFAQQGGGALLMHANTSGIGEQGAQGAGEMPSATDTPVTVDPFVQLASWGQGEFSPLMKVTSTGLSLDGENGDESNGDTLSRHEIRTGAGGLEIAPAAGETCRQYLQGAQFSTRRNCNVGVR